MKNYILDQPSILALFFTFKVTLELQVPVQDYDGLQAHLVQLCSLLGASVEAQTSATYFYNLKKKEIVNIYGKNYSPSIFKDMLDGECAEERAAMIMAERYNAAITHAIEGYRTIISAAKQDKALSKFAP